MFTGPTLITFSNEHPGAAARIFKEFAKGQDKFEIKAAAFEGNLIAANKSTYYIANFRRGGISVDECYSRRDQQTGSYFGSSSRSEGVRSCLSFALYKIFDFGGLIKSSPL